jgi:hypothetical protein
MGVKLSQKRRVVLDIDNRGDEGMVLRGRADHGGPADIDILHRFGVVGSGSHRRLERVEVHDQQVDRGDPVRLGRGHVARIVTQRQKPAVDLRVQRLDAPIHHLGKPGNLCHVADGDPGLAKRARGPAGGEQFDPAIRQPLRQFDQPGLVGHGKKGTAHRLQIGHGRVLAFRR